MNITNFMHERMDVCKELIQDISDSVFDSHDFIKLFAKRFEKDYVFFLYEYKSEPFRKLHSQIGKFLENNKEYLEIKDLGKTISPNIFGEFTQNEKWEKLN